MRYTGMTAFVLVTPYAESHVLYAESHDMQNLMDMDMDHIGRRHPHV